jgi:hypothetical protein
MYDYRQRARKRLLMQLRVLAQVDFVQMVARQ